MRRLPVYFPLFHLKKSLPKENKVGEREKERERERGRERMPMLDEGAGGGAVGVA